MKVSIQEVSAKEVRTETGETKTGISMEIQTGTKENGKSKECDKDCKIRELIEKGIRDEIALALVTNCKELAQNPIMCIKIGASIVKNESSGGFKCKRSNKFNCFGLNVKENYKSYNDSTLHWVGKYTKRWYKAENMSFFYSKSGTLPKSRYCMSEISSNSEIGCPTGLKISTDFYNSLSF